MSFEYVWIIHGSNVLEVYGSKKRAITSLHERGYKPLDCCKNERIPPVWRKDKESDEWDLYLNKCFVD